MMKPNPKSNNRYIWTAYNASGSVIKQGEQLGVEGLESLRPAYISRTCNWTGGVEWATLRGKKFKYVSTKQTYLEVGEVVA